MRNNMIVPREQVNATFRDILMYNDSDLLNIRDEMLSDVNQFLYLISMNK
jgi:hypothetical protein